jgi:CIC family chloride channel protein
LSAGAAGGMAAVFGAPVSAVILAVELLLFELRPRSLIPVALAAVAAAGVRYAFLGNVPVFGMPHVAEPGIAALLCYVVLGALIGLVSVGVTHIVYGIEDAFEKLPIHWMWWPAIGGVVVGVVGYFAPLTLGVGYTNIEAIVSGHLAVGALAFLCVMKFISWSIALGSGTSGGTLAPLFTIGGALGALAGFALVAIAPQLGIDPRIAGLVGMAAIFAGASRALLASVVFAFETTQQPAGLLPLLGGCAAAYLVSALIMRNTIMTEKIARRGVRVPTEYAADYLEQVLVSEIASTEVVTLRAAEAVEEVRDRIAAREPGSQHQGFPVLDERDELVGVVTRRDLLDLDLEVTARVGDIIRRSPVVIYDDNSAREAADHMVHERVGRLPVVSRTAPRRVIGIVSRSDLLEAHDRRLQARHRAERTIDLAASWGWARSTDVERT